MSQCQAWKAQGGGQCTRKAKDHPLFCGQHADPIKWLDPLVAHEFQWNGSSVLRSPAPRDITVEMDRVELGAVVAYAMDLEWYDAEEQLSRVFDSIESRKRAAAWEQEKRRRKVEAGERRAFIDSELNWAHDHGFIWVRTFSRERGEMGGVRHMTRSISPRRRFAQTECGLNVIVQRCQYDEIFKLKTCSQCQHAYKLEVAGLPIPEHPIEALKRAPVREALVAENRYPRQNGDETVPFEIRQFFDKKVTAVVDYLEKVGTVEDEASAIKAVGKAAGIGESIAGAVIGHLISMNMVEVERRRNKGAHDTVIKISLRPEEEWLDEKPDMDEMILSTIRDADGIADVRGGAIRLLIDVGQLPYSLGHVRHVISELADTGKVERLVTGRRTLWIGLPGMEAPDDVVAKYNAWAASKAEATDDEEDETTYELGHSPVTAEDLLAAKDLVAQEKAARERPPAISIDECREAVQAYNKGGSIAKAAELTGRHVKWIQRRLKAARERYDLHVDVAPPGGRRGPREQLPRLATPVEVAEITQARQTNVPDSHSAGDEGEIDYDQLADSMLSRVGHYLAERDDVITGQEALVRELRMEVANLQEGAGNRVEVDRLAKELAGAVDKIQSLTTSNQEYQRANIALKDDCARLQAKITELTTQLDDSKRKVAGVTEDTRRSVMGAAKEFLRGPKSDS